MTREELKEHCQRQIQNFERVEKIMPVTPNDWKRYEEHKLILELLEQDSILDKIRAEINTMSGDIETIADMLAIIDKYKAESEDNKYGCNENDSY